MALPNGFIDTGIRRSISASGACHMKWSNATFGTSLLGYGVFCGNQSAGACAGIGGAGYYASGPNEFFTGLPFGCFYQVAAGGPGTTFDYTVEVTLGDFILGVKEQDFAASTAGNPAFRNAGGCLNYHWFASHDTTISWATSFGHDGSLPYGHNGFGGNNIAPGAFWDLGNTIVGFPNTVAPPSIFGVALEFGASAEPVAFDPTFVQGSFSGLTINDGIGSWTVDTSELAPYFGFGSDPGNAILHGTGGGNVDIWTGGSGTGYFGGPWRFSYNFSLSKFGTGPWNGILLRDLFLGYGDRIPPEPPFFPTVATPYSNSFIVPRVSWPVTAWKDLGWRGATVVDIDPVNAGAQDPPLLQDILFDGPSDAKYLPILGNPAKSDPGGDSSFAPFAISYKGAVDVNRPDGVASPPSSWAGTGVTVTEHATSSEFDVAADGSTVTRTLVSKWRNWCGLGAGGHSNPAYRSDGYEVTKHDYYGDAHQDVWGWGAYPRLRMNITAPADGALALTLRGQWVSVSDDHNPFGRTVTVTPVPFTAVYNVPLVAGANSVLIDLAFPQAGGPFHPDRIDSLQIAGLKAGTYTLNDLSLVATNAKVKHVPHNYDPEGLNFSSLRIVVNGTDVHGDWGDQKSKPDEIGAVGGGITIIDFASDFGFIPKTLSFFVEQINRLEGWTTAWSTATDDAANKDGYGVTWAREYAQWLLPLAPGLEMDPDTVYHPPCRPVVRSILMSDCQEYAHKIAAVKQGGLEALVPRGDARAPAGVTVQAIREDTGAVAGSGVTDADGYVRIVPIACNGSPGHDAGVLFHLNVV